MSKLPQRVAGEIGGSKTDRVQVALDQGCHVAGTGVGADATVIGGEGYSDAESANATYSCPIPARTMTTPAARLIVPV